MLTKTDFSFPPSLKYFTVLAVFCAAFLIRSAPAQEIEAENIPEVLQKPLHDPSFVQYYDIVGSMNPFYLRGDFDADGKADYALWIRSKSYKELGIAVWLSSLNRFVFLGATTPFALSNSTTTDFDPFNTWQVFSKGPVKHGAGSAKPPRLSGDAILVGKRKGASGLIYWNDKAFRWYQPGD